MLFTTGVFVLAFLPVTWFGFFIIGRRHPHLGALWLFAASVCFYSWWMPEFTSLLLASIAFNFYVGGRIAEAVQADKPADERRAGYFLAAGVTVDLVLLGYFKYANFFVSNLNAAIGTNWAPGNIVLPIGISFYTFTQIAFLVDCRRRRVSEYRLVPYGVFATYFPHLIAGPVLHHGQMMPQFANPAVYRPCAAHIAGGLAIFALGMLKKVVLADGVAPYADAVFRMADAGLQPDSTEAWLGALAYTLQLYFDFSGYSDMAIGLSWLFNIRLPFNFDAPYRATSVVDFWRRWHMTLSAFLRDYLYIALGGNRHGPVRRYLNLMATMVLGGLWHGAAWSFVLWGTLHGLYLMINHAFRVGCQRANLQRVAATPPFRLVAWALTTLAVVGAWVFFRAETLDGGMRVLHGMTGASAATSHPLLWNAGLAPAVGWGWCTALGALALLGPNSNALGVRLLAVGQRSQPAAAALAALATGATLFLVLLNTARDSVSAFIYFNF